MSRPSMRFVPIKEAKRQAAQMLLGMREGLVRRRTQLSNKIRGHAAEFGLVAAKGVLAVHRPAAPRAKDDANSKCDCPEARARRRRLDRACHRQFETR
jgi:transposase